MNVDTSRSFPRLKEFAAFILENHAEAFTRDNIQRLKDEKLPLLSADIIKGMSEEVLFQSSLKSVTESFLKPLSEDKGLEAAIKGVENWKGLIRKATMPADVSISDIIITYQTRKLSLFKFLPLFEPISFEMLKEIEDFSKDSEEITFQAFVEIFENRIIENEFFVQKVTNASPNIIFLFDLEKMQNVYVSAKVKDILGYSVENISIINEKNGSLLHPDDREMVLHHLDNFKNPEAESFIIEYRTMHANGEWKWMRSHESVFKRDEKGVPIQIVGSVVDITDQKKSQEELKQLNDNLELRVKEQTTEIRKSYEQVKLILESLPQMAWTANAAGEIDYYSEAWLHFFGKTFETLKEQGWQDGIHPDDVDKTISLWQQSLKTSQPYILENRLRRAGDNLYRWHLTKGLPLKDENGTIIKWVGTTTDIHDQKTLTERLEKNVLERTTELMVSNEELSRSNKDLEQFAYVASHDLKEPLRMISSYLQLLANTLKGKLDEDQLEFISYISSGAEQMNALIRDLLNYSRIAKDETSLQKVDCNHVIEIVKQNLTAIIEETNTVIKTGNLPVITGVETQEIQLFQNLIANAIKFRKTDRTPVIEINAQSEPSKWLFSIKDNGIGIAPQFKEKIFVIFQRLHNRSEYPGTGIGLSVCKKIVELYNGKIWFESDQNNGTTFYFTIPKTAGKDRAGVN